MNKLETILKDSAYKLAQFSQNEIAAIEEKIYYKVSRGKDTPFIKCLIREKEIQLKPELISYLMLKIESTKTFQRDTIIYSAEYLLRFIYE